MLRTHVDLSEQTDLAGIEAILALREKVKPWVDIQIVAFLGEGYSTTKDGGEKLLRQAMKMGADVVGAATLSDADPSRHLDMLFKVAKDYNAEIDLHADETNDPEQSAVEIFAEKAIRHGWIGRVTGSHVCSLYWQSESVAQHVINKIKQAKMRIVTNPITNLYIHGKDPRLPTGPTRVQELLDNGVVVGMGTDNTRDVFSPAGNADMLLAALLLIYQRRILKPPILETALNMATKWGASIMKPAVSYGVHNGCQADLVLFDAYSLDEVITDLPQRCYVLKKGKITVEQNKLVEPLP